MKLLFWLSLFLIFFAYAGYPICLYLRARFRPRPIGRSSIFPRVTIILVVRNEENYLPRKLQNLAALNYPADLLDIVVVSDGSTDATNALLKAWEKPGCRAIFLTGHSGKANALNHAMPEAAGEIVCFTDARQILNANGLRNLVVNFADRSVGCASGALMIAENASAPSSEGVGLYWRLEKNIRNWEGLAGSTVGATGAFYAVRRELLVALPIGTILDDVYIPLHVARQGSRVVFDSDAIAWDDAMPSSKQEFARKVRTLLGNYQLLRLAPWLLTRSNSLRVEFVCHKLLRLLVPFALISVLVSTLWIQAGIYEFALACQMVFYALAILTALRPRTGLISRLANISLAFVMLNVAAALALVYFLSGRKTVWVR